MTKTKIEWADRVWNPTTGCTKVSEGCRNCYAERHAKRFWGDRKFTDVQCHEDRLNQPLHWRKPAKVFVNSMSDLFHEDVPDGFIANCFGIMHHAKKHTFIILTKRPERMFSFLSTFNERIGFNAYPREYGRVWLGVSVEDQETANERIPWLLKTPAAVRFVSYEPALGRVDLQRICDAKWFNDKADFYDAIEGVAWFDNGDVDWDNIGPRISWLICGGESGPKARPMHPDWARSARDQCKEARVPFFFKQWGEYLDVDSCIERGFLSTYEEKYHPYEYIKGSPISIPFARVGKKKAGHLLDGKEHFEFPRG